jgi:ribosome biogenesis GTPase
VADTPGLRELGLWEVDRDNLQFYFPEFEAVRYDCRYSGCTHVHEPGCAIRAAVDAGQVDPGRYESYRRMMTGEDDDFSPSSRW